MHALHNTNSVPYAIFMINKYALGTVYSARHTILNATNTISSEMNRNNIFSLGSAHVMWDKYNWNHNSLSKLWGGKIE